MSGEGSLARGRRLVEEAARVLVITGAGMSAESGVPTFRGAEGLWRNHRPEELATPEAFRRDPDLVWSWYRWRRGLVAACEPNEGHRAVAAFRARRPTTAVVTQNVDGLHQEADRRAGLPTSAGAPGGDEGPAPVLELHGRLFGDRCRGCDRRTTAERVAHGRTAEELEGEPLPRCPECGDLLRPDVVWFGEGLDPEVLDEAAVRSGEADLALVVGTSAVVQPAASLPLLTLQAGGRIVEVNPSETPLSRHAELTLRDPAGAILPELLGS